MSFRAFIAALVVAAPALAGPLTPPGAPAPSMKTLDEVEPSIPIGPLTTPGDATATYIISQPGSYHLTGELQGEDGKAGVLILASDVSLDLRGFTLRGLDAGALASGPAIATNQTPVEFQYRIVVRNGIIVDWPGGGVSFPAASAVTVSDLIMSDLGAEGVVIGVIGPGVDGDAAVVRCRIDGAVGAGIALTGAGLVQHCQVSNVAPGPGIDVGGSAQVIGCTVRDVQGNGIAVSDASLVSGCSVDGSGGAGISARSGVVVENCAVSGPAGRGISTLGNAVVRDSTIIATSQEGVVVGPGSIVERCALESVGTPGFSGISGSSRVRVSNCDVDSSGSDGVRLGDNAQVIGTTVTNAGGDGVEVGANSLVTGCVIDSPFLRGIQATTSATINDCTIEDAGLEGILTGIVANVQRCTVRTAGASAISVTESSSVIDCTINNAANDGVRVVSRSLVRGNTIDFCGSSAQLTGYAVNATGGQNRIEGNALTRADYCIRTGAGGNVIVNNSLSGWFTAATLLTGTNAAAPFLNSTTINSTPHPQANVLH